MRFYVRQINPPRLMFTIGRDREKEHARKFLGASSDPALLESVIDAVHNLLEGLALSEDTFEAFRRGFVDGRSGTWENTGSWLTKAVREFPALSSLWHEFAAHQSAQIRFRAAAHLTGMPEADAQKLLPILLADKSAKVRSKASGDMHTTKWAWAFDLLSARRQVESDSSVIDSLDFALASRSSV